MARINKIMKKNNNKGVIHYYVKVIMLLNTTANLNFPGHEVTAKQGCVILIKNKPNISKHCAHSQCITLPIYVVNYK